MSNEFQQRVYMPSPLPKYLKCGNEFIIKVENYVKEIKILDSVSWRDFCFCFKGKVLFVLILWDFVVVCEIVALE